MVKSKSFEPIKFAKRALLTSAITAGSLGIAGVMSEGIASASGNNTSHVAADDAIKIFDLYAKEHKLHPKDASLFTVTNNETYVTVTLPSVYGSFVLTATISDTHNINPETVSEVSIDASFPDQNPNVQKQLAAYYSLTLDNGQIIEAFANYINTSGTEYLGMADEIGSGITMDEYRATIKGPQNEHRINVSNGERDFYANIVANTIYDLTKRSEIGMPVNGGTVEPFLPFVLSFK